MTSDEQRDDGAAALLEEAMRIVSGAAAQALQRTDTAAARSLCRRYEAWREGRGKHCEDPGCGYCGDMSNTPDGVFDDAEQAREDFRDAMNGNAGLPPTWLEIYEHFDAFRADMRREIAYALTPFAARKERWAEARRALMRLDQGQDARGERGEGE